MTGSRSLHLPSLPTYLPNLAGHRVGQLADEAGHECHLPRAAAAGLQRCSVDIRCRRATTDAKSVKFAAAATAQYTEQLKDIDPLQAELMEEQCIVVDRNDTPLRPASKVQVHLCSEDLLLHRAFSVFLFNSEGKLLMQQRAAAKHTFPLYWTNTCCSHPLWVTAEMELQGGAVSAVEGAKVAAIRKLEQELGIVDLKTEDLKFITKLHYQAPDKNRVWGEHEIDYLYIAQADVSTKVNPNEIEQLRWVNQADLKEIVRKADAGDGDVTPWSKHIAGTLRDASLALATFAGRGGRCSCGTTSRILPALGERSIVTARLCSATASKPPWPASSRALATSP